VRLGADHTLTLKLTGAGRVYLLRATLMYKPNDLNRDWSPRFSTLRDKKRLDSIQNGLKSESRRVSKPFFRFSS
jgi:hypothetical protein